jgi:single-strand DNA-binding protein
MVNESNFSVAGYVATIPHPGETPAGVPTLSMRVAWTPRKLDRGTGNWADEPACFATVKCYRKLAENALMSVHKGDPVVVTGTLRIRDYEAKDGSKRTNVDVNAISIGHDLSRGVTSFKRVRQPAEQSAAEVGEEAMAGYPSWAKVAMTGHTGGITARAADAPAEADGEARDADAAAVEGPGDAADVTAGDAVAAPF